MRIPDNIEDAVLDLNGLDELVTASEWRRAAVVWAFTTNRQGQHTYPTSGIGVVEFATLGIAGLRSKNTVTKYRKAWVKAMERGSADLKPGDEFVEPDADWDACFNPPPPRLDRSPTKKKKPALEAWDESSWDCEKLNESTRLVRMNEIMWNTLDGLEGTDGEMLIRVGQSILDLVGDENKVRGIARMMHSVIEFASAYKTERRDGR